MPDTYRPFVLDLAGCMLGVIAAGTVLDGGAVAGETFRRVQG